MPLRRKAPAVLVAALAALLLVPLGPARVDATTGRPTVPRSVTVLKGVDFSRVTWRRPLRNGGSAVTAYVIKRGPSATGPWTTARTVPATARSVNLWHRSGSVTWVRVFAKNRNGLGPGSTALRLRSIARCVRVQPAWGLEGVMDVAWDRAVDGCAYYHDYDPQAVVAVDRFAVQQSTDLTTWTWAGTTDGSQYWREVPGLTVDTTYYYRVRPHTAAEGWGPWSRVFGTAALGRPGAPADLVATPGDGTITLTWTAPADTGGDDVQSLWYEVERWGPDETGWETDAGSSHPTPTTFVEKWLTNGSSYSYRVRTVNRSQLASDWSDVVTATPAAPTP